MSTSTLRQGWADRPGRDEADIPIRLALREFGRHLDTGVPGADDRQAAGSVVEALTQVVGVLRGEDSPAGISAGAEVPRADAEGIDETVVGVANSVIGHDLTQDGLDPDG